MKTLALLALMLALPIAAQPKPGALALLVNETDDAAVAPVITSALASSDGLTRATAARLATVRGISAALPTLRDALGHETDGTAARELARAILILGEKSDLDTVLAATRKFPSSIDDAIADAVARRGRPAESLELYLAKLSKTRMNTRVEYFTRSLWGRPDAVTLVSSRLIGAQDSAGWSALLASLSEGKSTPSAEMMVVSLSSPSEEIRSTSLWHLIRGYAIEPSMIPAPVQVEVKKDLAQASTAREGFGRELLNRMLGRERRADPRWLEWLATEQADAALQRDNNVLIYLTDEEYLVRKNHCVIESFDCAVPKRSEYRQIPSQAVARPAFFVPAVLPDGLGEAILEQAHCRGSWLGVAEVTVDPAGRVKELDLTHVEGGRECKNALSALARLSLASNAAFNSGFSTPTLVVHGDRTPACTDEGLLSEQPERAPQRVGGAVLAPVVLKRVEPRFPSAVRGAMGGGTNVIIIMESTISREGCIRNVQVLKQSPFPTLNGAAVMAISQWKFQPGRLDGKPVDVVFNLTVNFSVTH
jgi:TonB family protein